MNQSLFSLLIAGALLGAGCASGSSSKGVASSTDDGTGDGSADGSSADGAASEDGAIGEEDGAASEGDAGPSECGDDVCAEDETCKECAIDCGECPVCELAPTCTGAVALPTLTLELDSFDIYRPEGDNSDSIYPEGVDLTTGQPLGTPYDQTDCVAPELRLRLRSITITKDGNSNAPANVYCVIDASDGAHSEVMITPIQENINDGAAPVVFSPETSTFWGQGQPWQTLNNLTVTYSCFHSPDPSRTKAVFDAIQDGANMAGGIAGPWGWAFGVGSVAAGIVSAAIPEAQDDKRIGVQQIIDKSMLLDLTNGKRWTIRTEGDSDGGWPGGKWDWTLEVEAWGCSNARIRPR